MKKKIKIGFVSNHDAARLTPGSIHSFFEARALREHGLDVYFLGPLTRKQSPLLFVRRAFSQTFRGMRILPEREPLVVKDLARQISEKLKEFPVDVVFSHGTLPIGGLDCSVPIVFWSDATFAGMVGFYPGFNHLNPASLRLGNQLEQSALNRAALALYSSEWAARTCMENYQVEAAKVKVVPFGANLEYEQPLQRIEEIIQARSMQPCRLAFVGTEWERKGGDLALGLAAALNRSGLRTELKIIGCEPPMNLTLPDYVQGKGYLDTSTSAGQDSYQTQLVQAHFLVLPTRADCSPRVLYEAGAMGVPSLTTNVGGIESIIHPGVNGRLFPSGDAFVEPAAEFVLDAMRSSTRYQELAIRTIRYHADNHSWEKSAEKIEAWLAGIIPGN
jgi:glycosyltransferase involved in cell wall biosynthesis